MQCIDTAADMLTASVRKRRSGQTAERKRQVLPADPAEAAKPAGQYRKAALGTLAVGHDGADTVFDFGEWKSEAASRRNDDGTLSYMLARPGSIGWELVVADEAGKRRLIMRSAQQEYVFDEAPGKP